MKDIVRLQIPTPFPVGAVNTYLIKSEPITLIDTGPNTKSAREALLAALAEEGLHIRDIERVLITHGHSDHSGLAGWLEQSGAQICLHPFEAKKLTGFNYTPLREDFLRQMGTPPDKIMSFRSNVKTNISGCISAFTQLHSGNSVEFSDFSLTVIDTPGHCGGHLAFFHREAECLFGGDTVLKHVTPNPIPELDPRLPGIRSQSLTEMMATWERLENMKIQIVLPGHGETVSDVSGRIAEMSSHHERRLEYIFSSLTGRITAFSLAAGLYGDIAGLNIFLGVAEVCAHLDMLVQRGLVREVIEGKSPLSYFEKIS